MYGNPKAQFRLPGFEEQRQMVRLTSAGNHNVEYIVKYKTEKEKKRGGGGGSIKTENNEERRKYRKVHQHGHRDLISAWTQRPYYFSLERTELMFCVWVEGTQR